MLTCVYISSRDEGTVVPAVAFSHPGLMLAH